MAVDDTEANDVAIIRVSQDRRVASTGGGITIRREGKPVEHTVLRGGSVYLVIDCSSSMAGEKIAQAKEGALHFAQEALTKRYSVGLISFASVATHICEPREEVSQVRRHLPGLEPDGSTNMARAIELATVKFKGKPGPLAMVVVTDGMPDHEGAALGAARDAKKLGVDIITVGTDDADRSFLQKLASRDDLVVVVRREALGKGITSTADMLPGGVGRSRES